MLIEFSEADCKSSEPTCITVWLNSKIEKIPFSRMHGIKRVDGRKRKINATSSMQETNSADIPWKKNGK